MTSSYDDRLGPGIADRIRSLYQDAVDEMADHLLNVGPPTMTRNSADDLKWASALLGYGVYGNGCAIKALFDADVGRQLVVHVRSQFEAAVRMDYMDLIDPSAARDLIDAEPFERLDLARERTSLSAEIRNSIIDDARLVVRLRKDLQSIKNIEDMITGKLPLKPIMNKLKPKAVSVMIDQLNKVSPKWNRNLYTELFRIGSLGAHQSIIFLRDAFRELDGRSTFEIDQHYDVAPDYLLQSINYLIGFSSRVAIKFDRWDDGAEKRLKSIYDRHQALARETGAVVDNDTEHS